MPELPFEEDPGLEMLSADAVDEISADDALDAAEASALEDPDLVAEPEETPIPFGRSWAFDYGRQRFVRVGGSPAEVRGSSALGEWLKAMLHTAVGAHPGFTTFGLDAPDDWIGVVDPTPALATFERRFREGALAHERIVDVTDVVISRAPDSQTIVLERLTVITDEAEAIQYQDIVAVPEA
jgi:hypothetical protein